MVVKIRFGHGPVVTRRKGKNSRIAMLAASSLTLVSVCFTSMGVWRLTQDIDLTGDFVFKEGILSHWQVWTAAAVATQYGAWRLTRYAKQARTQATSGDALMEASEPSGIPAKV